MLKLKDLGPASRAECTLAIKFKYRPIPDVKRGRGWYKFSLSNRMVWQIVSGGGIMWQTADMIEGVYQNHQKFHTLAEAVHRPLTKM